MTGGAVDHRIELIEKLTALVGKNPTSFMELTMSPSDEDFAVMGKLIQLYCFADLNARRIIDAICGAFEGPDARRASRFQDGQVFPKLTEISEYYLPDGVLKDGIIKAARTVEMHRVHRHNFAHWAARKFKNHNALILFTKNAREVEKRGREAQSPEELEYVIFPLEGFEVELGKLAGHSDYLAHAAVYTEANIGEFVRSATNEAPASRR